MSMFGLVSDAMAEAAPQHAASKGGFLSMLPMLLILVAVFYFLLIRPQSKRAKEHRALMGGLTINDEVQTAGGIVGRIKKINDDFIRLEVSEGVELVMRKSSIATVLPKGTKDSL